MCVGGLKVSVIMIGSIKNTNSPLICNKSLLHFIHHQRHFDHHIPSPSSAPFVAIIVVVRNCCLVRWCACESACVR